MTSEFRGVVFLGIVAVCMKLRFVTNASIKRKYDSDGHFQADIESWICQ